MTQGTSDLAADRLDLAILLREAQAAPDEDARTEWLVAIVKEHPGRLDAVAGDWLAAPDAATQRLAGELLQQLPTFTERELGVVGKLGEETTMEAVPDEVRERLTVLAATYLGRLTDPGARAALLNGVRLLREPDLLPAVLRHVADPEPDVRRACAWALAGNDVSEHDDHEDVVRALVTLGDDEVAAVRDIAVFLLGVGNDMPVDTEATRALFRRRVDDEDEEVAWEARSALALLGDVPLLVTMLETEETDGQAIEVAAQLGHPDLHAPLLALQAEGWPDMPEDAPAFPWQRELLAEAIAACDPARTDR